MISRFEYQAYLPHACLVLKPFALWEKEEDGGAALARARAGDVTHTPPPPPSPPPPSPPPLPPPLYRAQYMRIGLAARLHCACALHPCLSFPNLLIQLQTSFYVAGHCPYIHPSLAGPCVSRTVLPISHIRGKVRRVCAQPRKPHGLRPPTRPVLGQGLSHAAAPSKGDTPPHERNCHTSCVCSGVVLAACFRRMGIAATELVVYTRLVLVITNTRNTCSPRRCMPRALRVVRHATIQHVSWG